MIINKAVAASAKQKLFAFTQGCDVDQRLCAQEIAVQRAWLRALERSRYLTTEEAHALDRALTSAGAAMAAGTFDWRIEDEDIHMNLERYVTEQCGESGRKLHLGRSRNDLIATTLKLFVHDEAKSLAGLVARVVATIAQKSQSWLPIIVPGLTHVQAGHPTRLGHIMAAHGHALRRDADQLLRVAGDARGECPLGSAAFGGTHLPVDLVTLAEDLGFARPPDNSYESVGNRDDILNLLGVLAILAVHMSRLCHEVIYFTSTAVALLHLPRDYSTGSSIMPNKRNPDVFELVRARMARVIAAANEGNTLVRDVMPSYGTDLHELKRTLMRAIDETHNCLEIMIPTLDGLVADSSRAAALLESGHVLATDIANHLATRMPFREAYQVTADWVAEAEGAGVQIQTIATQKTDFLFRAEDSVEARCQPGGSALSSAAAGIGRLKDWARLFGKNLREYEKAGKP